MGANLKNAIVLIPFEREHKNLIETYLKNFNMIYLDKMPQGDNATEIIIGNTSRHYLSFCNNLKWMQLQSAGSDYYVEDGVLPKGAVLTNSTGAYGHAIGEYMVGVTFELYKKLHLYRDNQLQNKWEFCGNVKSIQGSTVLVIGMGDIGEGYAKRMKALGAYVIGIRRTKQNKPDFIDEIHQLDELDNLLSRADIVSLSLPNTPQTIGLIDSERLEKMKSDAIIINVGRGTAIETEALCNALENGKLGGAALDVTDPEPLKANNRLWKMENVIITPHVSGGFNMRETYENVVAICLENIRRYIEGEALINQVDFTSGYRKIAELNN